MSDAQTESCPACGSLLDVTGAHIFAERTCPVCATPIHVRRKFGHYELMSVVGSGGQGVVYRAVDNNLNRLVALKLLRTEYSEDPEFVRQFEHEARLTASINHPNVVRVYSFGADEGHVYLAMELVDNGTMDDLLEKLGRIPEARALQIGIEVAQGLRAGHEKGLIHRDVKPGNVLFAQDGTAKIVDYGLAMFFEQAALASGEIWGTPYYLSPERLNKAPEDFRSDIYSLGAALFHSIAGRPPFEAEDASHVALKHLRSQAVSLQTFAPGVCNATTYVINRTLAKNPDERQQSYDEFIEQLQFAREEAFAKASGGGVSQQKGRLVLEDDESKKAMSWITLATLVIFLIGLIVGGLLILKGMKRDDDTPIVQPTSGGATDVASYGPAWAEARKELIAGRFTEAAAAFKALTEKHAEGTTERAFAQVHQSLALLFAGKQSLAVEALEPLTAKGTQVSKFFAEEVAPRMQGNGRIPAEVTRNYKTRTYEALAALFFALKNYEHSHFDDAGSLFRQFGAFSPDGSSAWISDYKELSRPLQNQLDSYTVTQGIWTAARNSREREQAYVQVRDMAQKIGVNSKLQPKVRELLAEVEKRRTEDLTARAKSNLAFRAKTQASGFDREKGDAPEKAVDGDPRTRWAHKAPGEKWLAVELTLPKQISRWVVKTAGAAGEKPELNISDLELQRSDDGKTWTTVDMVVGNKRDVIDRVVPPFTARHVRILSTKGGVKAKDNGFRVAEFELGEATEQAKAEYEPNQSIAMRFAAGSDFQFGPVGEPFALGSARYDDKSGKYTIKGGGADIWGTADNFHFAWQAVEGDCELTARVVSLQKLHEWSKAGVMVRADLTKDAASAMVACGPNAKIQFANRPETAQKSEAPAKENLPLPQWVRIQRQGATLIGSYSSDGQNWTELSRQTLKGLGATAYVGLAVCSHVGGQLAEAQFENVALTKK
jgi:eukaryotic-like serine/threonine-protein kinase